MKATLEFNLDNEDERYEHKCALGGTTLTTVIFAFDQKLREIIKYNDSISGEEYEVYQRTRDWLWELLGEYDCEDLIV